MIKRKPLYLCFLLLILLALLTACRIDFSGKEEFAMKAFQAKNEQKRKNAAPETAQKESNEETDEKTEAPDKSEPVPSMENAAYTLNGTVTVEGDNLHIQGTTSLPPGAIVGVRLRRYPNGTELEAIKEYRIEPSSIVDERDAMEVSGDGTFERSVKRPDNPFRYRIELYFIPNEAEKNVQDKLASEYGDIELLPGMIPIDTLTTNPHKERILPGFMKYGNLLKEDDEGGDHTVVELVPVKNIP
ncbi:hypothetical protein ACOJQI_11925 [Bacillus salacetis]|uniref:hypothetical protein n=1 Tax=Bacillus salacetis TaxID=2315464 RepID=UPI003B9DE1BB